MKRSLFIPALFVAAGLITAAGIVPVHAQPKPECAWTTLGGDHRDFKCPLVATGKTQRFRFKTMYSGGHDDTRAQMEMLLDGKPLSCAEGSKIKLFGEDGNISLECRFSLTGEPGTQHVLGVIVEWGHAQYEGFEFVQD
jgi:hypothetical protein